MEKRSEVIFLNEEDILVSDSRFVVDDQVYPLSGITYIELETNEPSSPLGVIIACVIVCIIGAVQQIYLLSIISVIVAMLALRAHSRTGHSYTLVLDTASGKIEVFTDEEYEEVERIYKALNDAIVHRG